MNTKRQTIWLVSMLSLMVVLSAYYLFTEDVSKLDLRTDKALQEEIKVDTEVKLPDGNQSTDKAATGSAQPNASGIKSDSGAQPDGAAKSDASRKDSAASGHNESAAATSAQTKDALVLEKLQQQGTSGTDYFEMQEMKRNEEFKKKYEQLTSVLSDSKKTADEMAKASDEIDKLQTQQAKIENIEDLLAKDYKSGAMLLEDSNKWKVVVHGDKLEKSQAVSIVDLVMKELSVTQDKVSVQLMR